jgi:hypothetical protein
MTKMKKIALALSVLGLTALAHAADPLNGTVWKTIDDKTKQAKALVKFTEQKNGTLTASIQGILTPGEENAWFPEAKMALDDIATFAQALDQD